MEVRETEKITREESVLIETLCDKCNEPIHTTCYNAFDFEFEIKTGESYPEGGSGDKLEMDLCQSCALELTEFLKLNGYRINESEWDW